MYGFTAFGLFSGCPVRRQGRDGPGQVLADAVYVVGWVRFRDKIYDLRQPTIESMIETDVHRLPGFLCADTDTGIG